MVISTELVRVAVRSFGQGDLLISNYQIYQALDITAEHEKDKVRARLNDMVKSGELFRDKPGIYQYNFKFRLRDSQASQGYTKIWRFVRQAKDGWTIKECSLLTGLNNSTVSRYMQWLHSEDYVQVIGKKENTKLFTSTKKAKQNPETPLPPHTDNDPFEKERAAGAKIVRLLLCNDLYRKSTAKVIMEQCEILQNRFGINENITKEQIC